MQDDAGSHVSIHEHDDASGVPNRAPSQPVLRDREVTAHRQARTLQVGLFMECPIRRTGLRTQVLKRIRGAAIALSVALIGCVPRPLPPEAPPWRGHGAYDARSMTRFGGEVLSVEDVRATDAAFTGLHVLVRVEKEKVSVHLGPKRFLDERDLSIMPGDLLEVTGVLTQYEGSPAVLATAVKKGSTEVRIQDRASPEESK